MADSTGIEWADATWNPIVGCSIVSPGCTHCYAMRFAHARLARNPKTPHYAGATHAVNGNAVWTGKVAPAPDHVLSQPLRWKRPRRIFVNSMGDLFHEDVPGAWIDDVYRVMQGAPQHTFLILTKRAQRMRDYHVKLCAEVNAQATRAAVGLPDFPLPNVWLGVSCEDQARADERVPLLLDTPAAVRFVSAEPLLGPIDLSGIMSPPSWVYQPLKGHRFDPMDASAGERKEQTARLDWVIAGGESGKGARPMHPDWARAIRDQCARAGVPFFFKQWGEFAPAGYRDAETGVPFLKVSGDPRTEPVVLANPDELNPERRLRGAVNMKRVGKRASGRTLDGAEHNALPETR